MYPLNNKGVVRSRGLEPPWIAPLAPQASAYTIPPRPQGKAGTSPAVSPLVLSRDITRRFRPEYRYNHVLWNGRQVQSPVPYAPTGEPLTVYAMEDARVRQIGKGEGGRARLAAWSTPPSVHGRHSAQKTRICWASPGLSRPQDRARRAIYLSRAGPARGLRDARFTEAKARRTRCS